MTDTREALIKELRDTQEKIMNPANTPEGALTYIQDVEYAEILLGKAADMLEALSAPGDAERKWPDTICNDIDKMLRQHIRWTRGDHSEGIYIEGWRKAARAIEEYIAQLLRRPVEPVVTGLPQDVINLVVAARKVAFSVSDFVRSSPASAQVKNDELVKIAALDRASEAFASRVPWDDAPVDHEAALNVSQPGVK